MKKAIALSLVLIFTVVAYGCQGGCGPQPANNANNANATKTATPAATPAMTPATTNTTSNSNSNANANKANTSPTKTP
ncbi:MAG TPA: hypothetical protein VMS29_03270 [Pyrinomonadaceae bacterium]|nr:hypothetical protein [Pyrinomonadaceae bacterium]